MNKQAIEDWIYKYGFKHALGRALWADDLRELLKTHAIVPRESTGNMQAAGIFALDALNDKIEECETYEEVGAYVDDVPNAIYKAMIEASEKGELDE